MKKKCRLSTQSNNLTKKKYVQKEQEHSVRDTENASTTLSILEAKAYAYKYVLEHSHRQMTMLSWNFSMRRKMV